MMPGEAGEGEDVARQGCKAENTGQKKKSPGK